ncbi:MAG TPA: bi-domain-containing oxidoreductase [Blastocatellia bacterium]|nr:bi-domain-containing oxidoreductase [Blastocatellia bacterium]
MKQVVQNFRTGELKVEELPPPALRQGGVLVRTAWSLISAGTERTIVETAQSSLIGKARERPDLVRQVVDTFKREGLRSTYEKVKARLTKLAPLGYSASGVVTAVSSDVHEFRAGDRVACAGGGYATHAEVIFVPKNLCCKVPDGVSLDAASYTTVGAIALQGVRQAEPRLGESVAVIGLGLVGQLAVQLLKAAGCRVLGVDIDAAACELAKSSGADSTAIDDQTARAACEALTEGRGVDCVLITAGTKSSEPIELAAELARDRARVIVVGLVGMDVPRHSFYAKELELRLSRSYGPGRYDPSYEEKGIDYPIGYVRWTEKRNMEAFLRLVAEGKIKTDPLTTHRFKVADALEAYNLILNRDVERCCGVVLEYPDVTETATSDQLPRARAAASGELGVSFIGAGNFARGVLLPIVKRAAKVQLRGVVAATGLSAMNAGEQFGFAYPTTDYQEILRDEDSKIVFIATRHDSHAKMAAEALALGKDVFVEKPLATNIDDLREVVSAARESEGLLMVGYNRRFAPIARELEARLSKRSGPMTILYRVNAGQLPAEHWTHDATEGGGRIIGEVCHFIDFAQFLTNSLPERVTATAVPRPQSAGLIDDSVIISLGLSDGSVASIVYTASGDNSVPKEHVEIFCDRSVARIDDFKSGVFIRGGKSSKLGGGSQDKGHAAELGAFLDAVRTGARAPISIESLTATSLACFAAAESASSGAASTIDLSSLFASSTRSTTL